jgi:hypothetical protein
MFDNKLHSENITDSSVVLVPKKNILICSWKMKLIKK